MNYFRPLFPFLLGWALILSTESFSHLALVNGLGQLLLFSLVVCLPIWRTGRMSYVDIGWPWGLVLLGCLSYVYSDGYWLRSMLVSLLVVSVGLRIPNRYRGATHSLPLPWGYAFPTVTVGLRVNNHFPPLP